MAWLVPAASPPLVRVPLEPGSLRRRTLAAARAAPRPLPGSEALPSRHALLGTLLLGLPPPLPPLPSPPVLLGVLRQSSSSGCAMGHGPIALLPSPSPDSRCHRAAVKHSGGTGGGRYHRGLVPLGVQPLGADCPQGLDLDPQIPGAAAPGPLSPPVRRKEIHFPLVSKRV